MTWWDRPAAPRRPTTPQSRRPRAAPGSVVATPTLWDSVAEPVAGPGPAGVLADRVTVLRTMRRFGGESTIAALADAVRTGDRARAMTLLDEGADDLRWLRPDDAEGLAEVTSQLVSVGEELVAAASVGDGPAALEAAGG